MAGKPKRGQEMASIVQGQVLPDAAMNDNNNKNNNPFALEMLQIPTLEAQVIQGYHAPGTARHYPEVEWVRNTHDLTIMKDHRGRSVSVNRLLATKPLRADLCSRPGPGGKKLTYVSGEGVTRTLNEVFGFDGWNLEIVKTTREECVRDDKGRFHVAYTAQVRLTHKKSGSFREDIGASDSIDRIMGTAVAHALKGSITDALKRAARHFGEKLGNSLYSSDFSIKKAPTTLRDALDLYDKERSHSKFASENCFNSNTNVNVAASPNVVTATATINTNGNNNNAVASISVENSNKKQPPNQSTASSSSHNKPTNGAANGAATPSNTNNHTATKTPVAVAIANMPVQKNAASNQNHMPPAMGQALQFNDPPVNYRPNTNQGGRSIPPLSAADRLNQSQMFSGTLLNNHHDNVSNNSNKENSTTGMSSSNNNNPYHAQQMPMTAAHVNLHRPSTAHGRNNTHQNHNNYNMKRPAHASAEPVTVVAAKKQNTNPYSK